MITVDFSEAIAASDLKVSRSRHLIKYILKHFRNAPLYILLFLPHGLVEDIFLVEYHVRVQ